MRAMIARHNKSVKSILIHLVHDDNGAYQRVSAKVPIVLTHIAVQL